VLTLLWHPNSIINPRWWNLYLRTLEYLNSKGAFFGTVSDIASQYSEFNLNTGAVSSQYK